MPDKIEDERGPTQPDPSSEGDTDQTPGEGCTCVEEQGQPQQASQGRALLLSLQRGFVADDRLPHLEIDKPIDGKGV